MIDAPLALAFTAGMLASVNPCGFAMLPAYLSYFLGAERGQQPAQAGVVRALAVGAVVSAGFMVLFAVAGMALSWLSVSVYGIAPWITLVIGTALVAVGLAMLAGWEPSFGLPKLERGGDDRTLVSMFLFGISYGIASLGCTLPVFLATVSGTFERANVASGVAVYVAYALGMTMVLVALTVTLALARRSLLHGLHRVLPYVTRVAGLLVVAAGAYVTWYGVVELRLRRKGTVRTGAAVDTVTGWSSTISTWVNDVGALRMGLLLALVVTLAVLVGVARAEHDEQSEHDEQAEHEGSDASAEVAP